MTNNRTTELREKLTERGVEWTAYEKELRLTLKDFYDTRWNAHGVRWSYMEINGKATLSPVGRMEIELTPEQAIAATLGSERELIDLAHNAWSMALCAMQGMPIPAEWGNAVECGLRKYGINVDEELA